MYRFRRLFVKDIPRLTRSEIFLIIETEATRGQTGKITEEQEAEMEKLDKKDSEMYEMIINVLENVIPEREAAETHKEQDPR